MERIFEILTQVGAMLSNDHFVGTSGRHFDTYINKDALFPHTAETSEIGMMFARTFSDMEVDVVAAPAMGGIILSQWTAYHLSRLQRKEILSVYAEKKDGVLTYTRGYGSYIRGKKVIVIEDLATTGGSLKTVIDLTREQGGIVVGASVMVNKNPDHVTADTFGVPFLPLAVQKTETYTPEDCPLCKNNIPINTTVGHGKAFIT